HPKTMPGARFFPGARLNFAENLLRFQDDLPAIVSISESRKTVRLTYSELFSEVSKLAHTLKKAGIAPGDTVAGFVPNCSESVIAMLSATALGASWTSCSPDFGTQGVLDRLGQVRARILFAPNAYVYNGKTFSCLEKIEKIAEAIPEIERIVLIPFVEKQPLRSKKLGKKMVTWEEFKIAQAPPLIFEKFPFNHPLYIMYSSGTTGLPKCIVHGAGGTLLQHIKELSLHTDLTRESTILYFTTCGWMMWNWLVSSLFTGCTVLLFDGSPVSPDIDTLWKISEDESVTHFGTSPKYIENCKGKTIPKEKFALTRLKTILSTGAPLLNEDFDWVYENVKARVRLSSISGGTDIISCFMLGNPLLPVFRGELQSFGLGMDVAVFNEKNKPVFNEKGELVCRSPFVSMPLYFWNDKNNERFKNAYFKKSQGVWFHGDFISVTKSQGVTGGIVVFGRSDTTLNPGGVRIGTAEIYRIVENIQEVEDSIVIGQPWEGDIRVVLFVKLSAGVSWSENLETEIKKRVRTEATPRHVPAKVISVEKIPYTISGKKVELAVLQVVSGETPKNVSALSDPSALSCYENLAELTNMPRKKSRS
ncbi:MAG: acetoacetate--CoA ligase, partial [Nitrospinota bacterium]